MVQIATPARRKLVIIGNGMAPGRMLEHLFEAASPTATTSPSSTPSRASTTTASCSRRCCPARSPMRTSSSMTTPGTPTTASRCTSGETVVAIDRERRARCAPIRRGHRLRQAGDRHRLGARSSFRCRAATCPASSPSAISTTSTRMLAAAASRRAERWSSAAACSGLEAAAGLALRGMDVTVLHLMPT